jgi:hypothetical protein
MSSGLTVRGQEAAAPPDAADAVSSEVEPVRDSGTDRPWPAAPLTEPLVTDRPDFTESAEAVPYGHFQLAVGYTFTFDRESKDRVRDHTAPEILLRCAASSVTS